MQLLYIVAGLIVVVLIWQGAQWALAYNRRRIRVKLVKVPEIPGENLNPHPELGQVRVRPRQNSSSLVAEDVIEDGMADVLVDVIDDGKRGVNSEILVESEQPNEAVVAEVAQQESVSSSLERLEPILPGLPIAEAPTNTSPSPFSTEDGFWAEAQHEPNNISQVETIEASFTPKATAADIPVLLTPAFVENMPANMAQQDLFADELIALPPRHPKSPAKITTTQKVNDFYGKKVEPIKQVVPESERVPQPEVQEVIVIYVVAGRQDFQGEELLRHILSYGLRYGDMSIFHRHEHPTGRGQVYFSMARAVEPGTFDLNTLSNETVSGVTFFMSLPGENSIVAYDLMVDTARRLANDLQGEVLNDQQQSFTRQLAEHYRERIQEFERRRLMKK